MRGQGCASPLIPIAARPPLANRLPLAVNCSTPEEFAAGHAKGAVNVAYMVQTDEGRRHNAAFLAEARRRGRRCIVEWQTRAAVEGSG